MEVTSFWVILVACLVPVFIAYLAVELDERDAYSGGWHKKQV